jgi:hypothetical protein
MGHQFAQRRLAVASICPRPRFRSGEFPLDASTRGLRRSAAAWQARRSSMASWPWPLDFSGQERSAARRLLADSLSPIGKIITGLSTQDERIADEFRAIVKGRISSWPSCGQNFTPTGSSRAFSGVGTAANSFSLTPGKPGPVVALAPN